MHHRILVVDDEPSYTRMLQRNLEHTGRFEVRTEHRGSAVLETAAEYQPHLILLDVMLPDMQGDRVANVLEADPRVRHIPYIFLTGMVTHDETGPGGGEIGGQLFLAKPVKFDALLAAIDRVLGRVPAE